MAKFRPGDRVYIIDGMAKEACRLAGLHTGSEGTILDLRNPEELIPVYYIRWDEYVGGHNCSGLCESGFGWNEYEDNLAPIPFAPLFTNEDMDLLLSEVVE